METIYIEIRSAEGGDDSKLLVLEQLHIYEKYCNIKSYWLTILETKSGFIHLKVTGKDVIKSFKNESGGHRWQRIPPTESKGRKHTSTITVAILEEIKNLKIDLKPEDLKITTARGSGAGGQHRNKTDSAVTIKHKPTNIIIHCENERSQRQNKEQALQILKNKLYHIGFNKQHSTNNKKRKNQIGSGMRGDKIRTIRVQDGKVINHLNKKKISFKEYYKGNIDKLF